MKRTLLLFFTPIIAALSTDYMELLAKSTNLTREELVTCFNKTNVTFEDVMHVDVILEDDLQTIDFDDTALKVGCLFVCIFHKTEVMTGMVINENKIKEMYRTNFEEDEFDLRYQTMKICSNRVKNETNECELGIKLMLCLWREINRRQNNNSNE